MAQVSVPKTSSSGRESDRREARDRIFDENGLRGVDLRGKDNLVVYMLDVTRSMEATMGALKRAIGETIKFTSVVSSVQHVLVLYGDFDSERLVTVPSAHHWSAERFVEELEKVEFQCDGTTGCNAFDIALRYVLRCVVPEYRRAGVGGSVLVFNFTDKNVRLKRASSQQTVRGKTECFRKGASDVYDRLKNVEPPIGEDDLLKRLREADVWLRTFHAGTGKQRYGGYARLQIYGCKERFQLFLAAGGKFWAGRLGAFLVHQIVQSTVTPFPMADSSKIELPAPPSVLADPTLLERSKGYAEVDCLELEKMVGMDMMEDIDARMYFPEDFGLRALLDDTHHKGRWRVTKKGHARLVSRTNGAQSARAGSLGTRVEAALREAASADPTLAEDCCDCESCSRYRSSAEARKGLALGRRLARSLVRPMLESDAGLEICSFNPDIWGALYPYIRTASRCREVSDLLSGLAEKYKCHPDYHPMLEGETRSGSQSDARRVFNALAENHENVPAGTVVAWLHLRSAEFRPELLRMGRKDASSWFANLVWTFLGASPTPQLSRKGLAWDAAIAIPVFEDNVEPDHLANALGDKQLCEDALRACTVRSLAMLVSERFRLPPGDDSATVAAAVMGCPSNYHGRCKKLGSLMCEVARKFVVRETGCGEQDLDAGFDRLLRLPHDDPELQRQQPLKPTICNRAALRVISRWVSTVAPKSGADLTLRAAYALCKVRSFCEAGGMVELKTRTSGADYTDVDGAVPPELAGRSETVVVPARDVLPWRLVNEHVFPSVVGGRLPFSSWEETTDALCSSRFFDGAYFPTLVEEIPPLNLSALTRDHRAVGRGRFDNAPGVWEKLALFALERADAKSSACLGGADESGASLPLHPGGQKVIKLWWCGNGVESKPQAGGTRSSACLGGADESGAFRLLLPGSRKVIKVRWYGKGAESKPRAGETKSSACLGGADESSASRLLHPGSQKAIKLSDGKGKKKSKPQADGNGRIRGELNVTLALKENPEYARYTISHFTRP